MASGGSSRALLPISFFSCARTKALSSKGAPPQMSGFLLDSLFNPKIKFFKGTPPQKRESPEAVVAFLSTGCYGTGSIGEAPG